jgi:hypothetical protein
MQGTADDELSQCFAPQEAHAPPELCHEVLLTQEHLAEEPAASSCPDATEVSCAIARWDTTFRLALLRTTGQPAFWFFLTWVVCSHR